MKCAAIIAEYDPFHYGHKYHIARTREQGATHIMCVMSGDFVQRGDVAVCDKFIRARAALENGADIVIELPAQYAVCSAERFALKAVEIIKLMGCADMLSFGSECGDIELIKRAADRADNVDRAVLSSLMNEGYSYPAALTRAVDDKEISEVLSSPNDILAVEYIRALKKTGCDIVPFAVKRRGAMHDSDKEKDGFLSASEIRKRIRRGVDVLNILPYNIGDSADISRIETAMLAVLRGLDKDSFSKLPDISNGAQNRLYRAIREADSLAALYAGYKSKRTTLSSARRLVMCAFLGIKRADADAVPAYIRVLGMNGRGKELLSAASCPVAVDTSLARLSRLNDNARRQAFLQSRARDMYALALKKRLPCGTDLTAAPIILP